MLLTWGAAGPVPLRRENRHIILSLGLTTLVQVFISQHWQSLEVQVF